MDCDGVMTDGRLWLTADGDEQKAFDAHDGQGISLCHRAGLKTGIITGRKSSAVDRRAEDLKMGYVRQYAKDKVKALGEILKEAGLSEDECAYIGDDLGDVSVMQRVELAAHDRRDRHQVLRERRQGLPRLGSGGTVRVQTNSGDLRSGPATGSWP